MAATAEAMKEPRRAKAERLVSVSTRVTPSLWRAIRVCCAEQDLDMQIFVQEALTRHLKRTKR
jgi:hypothetical protein